jgi:tRNA pseudouridine38-40 synthase
MRYLLDVSYNGSAYHGWQVQKNAISVQEVLNNSLSLKLGVPIETIGSGRTDKGVHAIQQFAHFDFDRKLNPKSILFGLNNFLPKSISVNNINLISDEAHARFDAVSRSYIYKINKKKNPFLYGLSYYYSGKMDLGLIEEGSRILEEETDFQCFSKVKTDVNHFLCDIIQAKWMDKTDEVWFQITADRFLRGMVRAIVGTLLDLGSEKISMDDFKEILQSKDRKKAGRAVPAYGLYLNKVKYPKKIFLK